MNLKTIAKRIALLCIALLACLALASCGKTKKPADIDQFRDACKNDGLTVSSVTADDPDSDILEYAAYGHGQDDVLVQFYHFKDEATAKEWYLTVCENAEAGPSATICPSTMTCVRSTCSCSRMRVLCVMMSSVPSHSLR